MKLHTAFLALVLILLAGGCTVNRPVSATANPLGSKVGVFTQKSPFFLLPSANTDAAIRRAAENGGITKIATVDYNVTYFLIFTEYRTIVGGE
jgi:hypothetical protein